jgi:ribose-phosphate pyrophosphokinase
MMPLVLALPGDQPMARRLATRLGAELVSPTVRRFPDGETYARIEAECRDRDLVLVATLHRPDDKILPIAFLADAARDLGARNVVLAAPYLAYLRQDRRFQPGEAITSRTFARVLSGLVDGVATIDPHLHRYASLDEIYTIPSRVLHAAPLLAGWIREHVARPLLIGPDEESAQWVADVAGRAGAPHVVLRKIRRGDRDVEVSVPDVDRWRERTPVLVDDIVSTARTMIETVGHLRSAGLPPPVCVGVHAVFAGEAYDALRGSGVADIVTTDAIGHPSNRIAVDGLLAEGLTDLLSALSGSG